MSSFLLLIIAQLVCLTKSVYTGGSEFGRRRTAIDDPLRNRLFVREYVAESRHKQQQKSMDWSLEASLTDFFDVHRATLELSMSLSMSMLMSGPHLPVQPTGPSGPPIILTTSPIGTSPTGPSGIPKPSPAPAGPSGTPRPPFTPKPSNALGPRPFPPSGPPRFPVPLDPTTIPVFIPSVSPIFSSSPQAGEPSISPNAIAPFVSPSMSPISLPLPAITPDPMIVPTNTPSKETTTEPSDSGIRSEITGCQNTNSLKLGTAADERSTPVAIDISYSAESNNSFIEEFETELEDEFIRTAVFAIFGCNPETQGKIAPNTEEIINATCDPTMDGGNECFVLQTTFIIGVEGPVDTDSAAYLVYTAIQENMNNGTYVEEVEDLVFLEFLSPLPLIKPPSSGGGNSSPDGIDSPRAGRDVDVNPWTIGFSVASVMGGFVSLLVYARSKRSRQGHLLEDTTPWVNPENDTVI